MDKRCTHTNQIKKVHPGTQGCEDCLKTGDDWVHLRLCMTCGHVGCCDSSPGRHATAHHDGTGHRVIKSFEPGEDWAWCYADEEMVAAIPAFPVEQPTRHYESPGAAFP